MDIPGSSFKNEKEQQTPFSSASGCSAREIWVPRHSQTPPSGPGTELSVVDRQHCFPKVSLIDLGLGRGRFHWPHSRLETVPLSRGCVWKILAVLSITLRIWREGQDE